MNFKNWLQNNEGAISRTARLSMQEPYSEKDLRKNINPGDIIHFGFDTKSGGKKTVRYGVVTHVDHQKAVVYQFSENKYKEIPLEQLVYIIFTAIPNDVLSIAQKELPNLFSPGQEPDIDYFAALRSVQGEIDDNLSQMPKALMKLTEKQLKRYRNQLPTGEAPIMTPNNLLMFLSKKEPEPEESDPVRGMFEPEILDKSPSPFAHILDIMKKDKPKPGGGSGGLSSRVKDVTSGRPEGIFGDRPRSGQPPISLDDLRRMRRIPKKPESILDRI